MRDRQRLELLPDQYQNAKQRERERNRAALLKHLAASRDEEWYRGALATARAGFGECPAPSSRGAA